MSSSERVFIAVLYRLARCDSSRTLEPLFRRARRLAIAIVGIMGCYELIDEVLSSSGRKAGLRHYDKTVGYSLVALARGKAATSDAVAEQQQGQEQPDT